MNTWVKNTIGIISSLILLAIILIIGSIFMLQSSLPEYNGVIKVNNINDKINIYRDHYGVPFIYSQSNEDAYFALGYAHAQERLFQMDLSRRAGEGRLSEIFGSKTIKFDKLFRTIGLEKLVKESYEKYDSETKSMLLAYSNGVNEFINNSSNKFTIEFDILNYKPYEWKPEHSLLIIKLMAWELNISWWSDIALTNLIQKFGEDKIKDLLPTFDENGPTIIPEAIKQLTAFPQNLIEIDREFRKFIGFEGIHLGSNNWVVNGDRSISGKPIIANDPHLSFTAPGKWYVSSIRTPDLAVDGFTLPGVPGVVIGKNENISWVVTNVMADDSDFYIEQFDSTKSRYLFNEKWLPLDIITDTVIVKDSTNVIFKIKKNHRGPIISDIHNYCIDKPQNDQKLNISMKWTALNFTNELLAFKKINSAKNWNEFKSGLELFTAPGQNFVFADKDGNIGYKAGLKLPKRKNNIPSFVYSGINDENDWDEYVSFSENPELYNPASGYIASANNKTIKDYKYHISNVWEPNSRINRITELLYNKEKHSVNDFQNYQNDFYSHYAKSIVPYFINSFNDFSINDRQLKIAIQLLKNWDFILIADSQVPTIYAVCFQFLLKNILEDELGEELLKEYIFLANIPYRVLPKLLEENNSKWFDNISTETVIEDRDEILRKSLIDAIEFLEKKYSKNIELWQWGKIHKVTFKHFFHGKSGLLDKLLDIGPFEIGGDGTTVFNAEYSLTKPYENKLGPSLRYIYDFAERDNFYYIMPTGQSGHFYSDHYDDMTTKWLNGDLIKINTNIDTVKNSNHNLLQLIPQN